MATNKTILNIEINENVNDYITAVQQDSRSRFLDVMLFDNGVPIDLTGHTARIYAIKPDGKEVYNNGVITDAKNGRVQFELTSQTLAVAGLLNLQIILYRNNTEILSTNPFKLFILESLMSKNAIQSSNEYGALVITLRDLESAKSLMQEMVKKIGSPGQIATSLNLTTMYGIMDEILKMLRDSSVVAIKNKLDKIDTTTTNTNTEIPTIKKMIEDSIENTKKTYLDLRQLAKKIIQINTVNGAQETEFVGNSSERVIHVVGTFTMKQDETINFTVKDGNNNIFYSTTYTAPTNFPGTTTSLNVTFGYVNAQHLSASQWAYQSDEQGGDRGFTISDPLGLGLAPHSAKTKYPSVGYLSAVLDNYTANSAHTNKYMNLVAYYTKTNYFPNRTSDNIKVSISGKCSGGGTVVVYKGRDY